MIEIERKFVLKNTDFLFNEKNFKEIKQGYLNTNPDRTVRVRTLNNQGFLTVKGRSFNEGTSRFEFETEIQYNDALELLKICEDFIIEKTRYYVNHANQLFEIDVFHGANEGLILAEIELNTAEQEIALPDWILEEVTGDVRYYNAYLSKKPYTKW